MHPIFILVIFFICFPPNALTGTQCNIPDKIVGTWDQHCNHPISPTKSERHILEFDSPYIRYTGHFYNGPNCMEDNPWIGIILVKFTIGDQFGEDPCAKKLNLEIIKITSNHINEREFPGARFYDIIKIKDGKLWFGTCSDKDKCATETLSKRPRKLDTHRPFVYDKSKKPTLPVDGFEGVTKPEIASRI